LSPTISLSDRGNETQKRARMERHGEHCAWIRNRRSVTTTMTPLPLPQDVRRSTNHHLGAKMQPDQDRGTGRHSRSCSGHPSPPGPSPSSRVGVEAHHQLRQQQQQIGVRRPLVHLIQHLGAHHRPTHQPTGSPSRRGTEGGWGGLAVGGGQNHSPPPLRFSGRLSHSVTVP